MHKEKTGSVMGMVNSEPISPPELLAVECDILIPAALENAIDATNAGTVKARSWVRRPMGR